MSKRLFYGLYFLLVLSWLSSGSPAQRSFADEPQTITYQQLLNYVELEVKEEKLLKMLADSPTKFTLGEDQIAKLRAVGASDKLLETLRNAPTPSLEQSSDIRDFVIVLDASASMRDEVEPGVSKWDSAKKAASDLIRSIPNARRLAFIVYGNDINKRCQSIELIRPLEAIDEPGKSALMQKINSISPAADTPIGASLSLAKSIVANTNVLTKVILITDGMESCKGDPVAEAGLLAAMPHMQGGLDVIGYGLKANEIAQVEKIARSGRGKFYNAENAGLLRESVAAVERTISKKMVAAPTIQSDADLSKMYLVVRREYSWEPGLRIEPMINGTSVGVFSDMNALKIGHLLKKGENTIEFRSSPVASSAKDNTMQVSIGEAKLNSDGSSVQMDRVLWSYDNDADWSYQSADGKFVYKMNPSAKESTVTAKVMLNGLQCETPIGHGDFVIEGKYEYSWASPITATIFVNNQPTSSLLNSSRTLVISSLLKPGNNEIKIVSRGVDNSLASDNALNITIGKCKFNPANNSYTMTSIESRNASAGLVRNDDNEFVSKENSSRDYYEQTFTVNIDKLPNSL